MIGTVKSPLWHPFTQHGLEGEMPEVASAEGSWLTLSDGRRILDGISSWWVVTHGHRQTKIVEAIQRQTAILDQVIFAGFTHAPAERTASLLLGMAPAGLKHVFFSDSGSTAVEVALKMALGYWRNIGETRTRILALEHAYHGDTIGTMSAGARGVFNAPYEPLLFEVGRIPFPASGQEERTLEALERECRGGETAALIVEPLVLGAGGMHVYSEHVLARMRAICARHDVLFIADEVMTGFGRTGAMFACESAGITPDIMCVAKGLTGGALPLAATLCVSDIFAAHYSNDRAKMFFHSSSYTANPICCAAAAANLEIWRDEPVLECVAALVRSQAEHAQSTSKDRRFERVRQIGTILAFDLADHGQGYLDNVALDVRRKALQRGLLLRPLGSTIYVMPPYCTTPDELAQIYACISDVANEVGA